MGAPFAQVMIRGKQRLQIDRETAHGSGAEHLFAGGATKCIFHRRVELAVNQGGDRCRLARHFVNFGQGDDFGAEDLAKVLGQGLEKRFPRFGGDAAGDLVNGVLETFAIGDVFVATEDSHDFVRVINQRDFGRSHPDGRTVALG